MSGTSRFVAQFFPIFLLGALFGKLMDETGSVSAIADAISKRLGAAPRRAGGGRRRRDRHLWRRQPPGFVLRHRSHGGGAVPVRGYPASAHACHDRAWHLHVHHVRPAGRARDPERDSHAIFWHHAVRSARSRADRRCDHPWIRPVVARPRAGRGTTRRRRFRNGADGYGRRGRGRSAGAESWPPPRRSSTRSRCATGIPATFRSLPA